jgi:hypothetical protein
VIVAANDNRLPPPPFWRTGYFMTAMSRPDRRAIDLDDVKRALERPTYRSVQPDGPSKALGLGRATAAITTDYRRAGWRDRSQRVFRSEFQTMTSDPVIRYFPQTDTMAIELRPWPEASDGDETQVGGEDGGDDLVIHYAPDGEPWLWEIEHASLHPEHIAAALAQIRSRAVRAV